MENFAQQAVDFFMFVGQLKTVVRTGWTHFNVEKVESVSDHMYRMATMTMLLEGSKLDKTRALKLALVHDLAECIVGDITPQCGVSPEEKHQKELDAMLKIKNTIPNKEVATEIMELWNEYNNQESLEAKCVKDIDRFEMILQAYEYEKAEDRPGDLQTFYDSTKGKFKDEQIKKWVDVVYSRRAQLIDSKKNDKITTQPEALKY